MEKLVRGVYQNGDPNDLFNIFAGMVMAVTGTMSGASVYGGKQKMILCIGRGFCLLFHPSLEPRPSSSCSSHTPQRHTLQDNSRTRSCLIPTNRNNHTECEDQVKINILPAQKGW